MNNSFIRSIVLIIFIFTSNSSFSQDTDHWESIFGEGESCPYLVPDRDLGTAWQEINYDDSNWEIGEPGFGYGDDDDATEIDPTITLVLLPI